jgi:hypothetical protein
MKNILNSQIVRQLILVLVGAFALYTIVHIFNIYGLPSFLRSYWNYRNGIPYAWTDLFFEISLLAGILLMIAACAFIMASGLSPHLDLRFGFSRGLMICGGLTLIDCLFMLAGSVLKSVYYYSPIGWSAFLMRSFTGMLVLNIVFFALTVFPCITSILRTEMQSNLLIATIFNITIIIWAPAYAAFIWFTRYSPLFLIFLYGIISCGLGLRVFFKGVPFSKLLLSNSQPNNYQKLGDKENYHPSFWTTISGVIVLSAGVWIVITGILMARY